MYSTQVRMFRAACVNVVVAHVRVRVRAHMPCATCVSSHAMICTYVYVCALRMHIGIRMCLRIVACYDMHIRIHSFPTLWVSVSPVCARAFAFTLSLSLSRSLALSLAVCKQLRRHLQKEKMRRASGEKYSERIFTRTNRKI